MKRIVLFLLIIIVLLSIPKINAAVYTGRFYEQGYQTSKVGVFAKEKLGRMDYNGWYIKSTKDNNIYYCIDPATPLSGAKAKSHNLITGKNNMIKNSKLTTSKFEKVNLLAYYGYGYKEGSINHSAKKWYGITQTMIWRIMRTDLSWTFKASRNGKPNSSLFKNEVNEMNTLVNNHKKKSSFAGTSKRIKAGETITLTDSNKVLSYYNISSPKNTKIIKNGNTLKITGQKKGKETVTFKRNQTVNNNFELFTSRTYQDIVKKGTFESVSFTMTFEVISNNIILQKEDSEKGSVPQEGLNFKGAVYGVYNSNDKKIGEITTDDKGKGSLSVANGSYKIKEIKAPVGYTVNDETYNVDIKDNDSTVKVKDTVIKGKLEINKVKGSKNEEYQKEQDAEFEIYSSNNKKIGDLKTDEKGYARIELNYGKYKVKQVKGAEGYVFINDFEVDIKEAKNYTYDLKNEKETKLVFTKTDFSTEKPIPDTLIEIYKEEDNKLVFEGRTDKNGYIEVEKLKIGKYYILEKDAPKYYLLNRDKMPFEVKENGDIIKCNMENHRKEGFIKIIKKDANENTVLKGAKFDIYFEENNKKIHSGTTDANGEIKTDRLIAGKYCIYETKAPKGYKLNDEKKCIEIDEHEKEYEVIVKNKKNILIPDTHLNKKNKRLAVVIICISLAITIYILYESINSKKN